MSALSFCYVYKSLKKEHCYLYLEKENNFDILPESIQTYLGKPIFVMKLPLITGKTYPVGTAEQMKEQLKKEGFFIQLLDETDFEIKNINE